MAAALLGSLATAATAAAEPARNTTMGPGALNFKWDAVGSGILATQDAMDAAGCVAFIHDCDDTLIEVKTAGKLTIITSSSDPLAADTDLQLFASNANGDVEDIGAPLQEGAQATPTPNETVSVEVDPGFYVARIDYAIGANGTVQGEAKFEPSIPLVAATVAKPGKKVKSFKGNITGEGEAQKIEVGLLKLGKGGKCTQLSSAAGKFAAADSCDAPTTWVAAKGTKAWSLKLKKRLAKGKYVVFARATDANGLTQTEFGADSKRSFSAK